MNRRTSRHPLPFVQVATMLGLAVVCVSAICASRPAIAASASKPAKSIGPISFHYGHLSGSGVGKPSFHAVLTEGFTLNSSEYDVSGATAHIWGTPKAIQKITADGAGKKQVKVVLNNTAEATKIQFLSDHAEMVPDPIADQPTRQKLTFTGNVTMYVNNPAALEETSTSTMDKAIVYLGNGPDYPMIEADNVKGTAVPAK